MSQEITTFEEAARAVEPIFRKYGWKYHGSAGDYADFEEIERTMRRLAFNPGFRDETDPDESIASGRILVTRDALGPSDNTRSIYLHLFDI